DPARRGPRTRGLAVALPARGWRPARALLLRLRGPVRAGPAAHGEHAHARARARAARRTRLEGVARVVGCLPRQRQAGAPVSAIATPAVPRRWKPSPLIAASILLHAGAL